MTFAHDKLLIDGVNHIRERNPEEAGTIRHIAISVQGILDPEADALRWSPIPHVAGCRLATPMRAAFDVPVRLQKRGGLLAEGARLLFPEFDGLPLAAMFIGSTVGMGLSVPDAHGAGSDPDRNGVPRYFSNVPDSHRSSLGSYLISERYAGKYGGSMRTDGLESTNNLVRRRGIVMHPSNYVSADRAQQGMSWGCPAVPYAWIDRLIGRMVQIERRQVDPAIPPREQRKIPRQ